MYNVVLFFHLLGATIWTGGHLILACTILPKVLRDKDVAFLSRFESSYEKIGIPALVIQILSGLYLSYTLLPDLSQWFNFTNPISRLVSFKLILLACTFLLAIDARLRIIPNLSEKNLTALAYHIIPVTVLSVLFAFVGISFRTGWLF
ncbi:copper resistance protein CopD [Microbulbifer sp. A4B17]|uniref:CopD family protein n=1 Tax=Microbulbifer sp. A4B17 TaxID=359370 RepID=UPI000D52CBD3|nr:copper resistance protein CopD [Microbulbifer sp. A4B17]AWF80888.1 copper resistance protein CopD [Microbulbifer sp. A4B17]